MSDLNKRLVVAISKAVTLEKLISRKLHYYLDNLSGFDVVAVNDVNGVVKSYCELTSRLYEARQCRARVEARQVLSKASMVLVLWDGFDLNDLIFYAINMKIPYRIVPVPITTVVNKDAEHEFDLYIGRGGPWGNPFPIKPGTDETRDVVIEKYREYFEAEIVTSPDKHAQLMAIQGYRLGCHCKPSACHGDVIADYLNHHLDENG